MNRITIGIGELERRLSKGESLRSIGRELGVSHQSLREYRIRHGQPPLRQGFEGRASQHRCWRGGQYRDQWGYLMVYAPRPGRVSEYVHKHVLVAEEKIGRLLIRGEVVHHIDGDKQNNDPDNLLVVSRSHHRELHRQLESLGYELMRHGIVSFNGERYVLL